MSSPAIPRPNRIAVIGCSGAGKSSLATELARRLNLPYVPTDHAFWTDDWSPVAATEVRAWLAAATGADRWVLDGNFDPDRDLYWTRAELIVWLDLPRPTILWRVLRRNITWWLWREQVWGGRRTTLAKALSGVRHAARSHGKKRRDYPAILAELPATRVVRIRSSQALGAFLSKALNPELQ